MAAFKGVKLTGRDQSIPVYSLVNSDAKTSGLRLSVDRYAGGVDLGGLGWSVRIVSGSDSDIGVLTPVVSDHWITFDWTFPQIVAAHEGLTVFQVAAVDAAKGMLWQSGKYTIMVSEAVSESASYTEEELSLFQQAISNATVKLNAMSTQLDGFEARITTAVGTATSAAASATSAAASATSAASSATSAAASANAAANSATSAAGSATNAATSANTAAGSATSAAASAGSAAVSANSAADSATEAASSANSAASTANTAASDANTAASAANTAAAGAVEIKDTLEAKLAAGEFKGEKGDKGDTGGASEESIIAAGYTVKSIKAGGVDVVPADGVANIPIANESDPGVVKINSAYGIALENGTLMVNRATSSMIVNRVDSFRPITCEKINAIVKAALTDSNKMVLNGTQKATARDTLGAAAADDLTAHTGDSDIHVTADDKAGWNAKQDAIGDLDTIRSGAAAGATALQSVPVAGVGTFGLTKPYRDKTSYGITMDANGAFINGATADDISARTNKYKPITAYTLDAAVKAALTDDSRDTGYSDDEKANARGVIGAASDGELSEAKAALNEHKDDTTVHVTESEKTSWNGKQSALTDADKQGIVKSGITSVTLTDAEKSTACGVIGAERVKGDWVFVATVAQTGLTPVDFSQYTEIFMSGTVKADSAKTIYLNSAGYTWLESAIPTSTRYIKVLARKGPDGYIETVYGKMSSSPNYVSTTINAYDRSMLLWDDIIGIFLPEMTFEGNVKIYAR